MLYLLNDSDLNNLEVVTKDNYLNRNNSIKLFNKDQIIQVALDKYGNMDHLNKLKELKNDNKKSKIKKLSKSKEEREKKLLNIFYDNGYMDKNDIISEYPCYLYIEFSKTRFLKEVSNNIQYNHIDVFNYAKKRIDRRNILLNELNNRKLNYRPDSSIINNYINGEINLESTIDKIDELDFFWNYTIYSELRKNIFKTLDSDLEKDDLKNDVIYYHLLTSQNMKFPNTIKKKIENLLRAIVYFKEENINIELLDNSEDLYTSFIKTIRLRNNIILHLKDRSDLPIFLKDKINNSNNILISYE